VPAGLSGVVAIASGIGWNLAVIQDKTVVAWGRNDYGQITLSARLSGVITISAGYGVALDEELVGFAADGAVCR
jgi:hypothetical protein